ncbi:ATP-binding protein [Candidatus Izemoplasma sp. B36]|uniref:HAMP domain-containing sensor histidine kinase n=1 Tax=Candidatus Izemoplasma sp. B36 TaxID=3242468 RepID=UPI003555EDAF
MKKITGKVIIVGFITFLFSSTIIRVISRVFFGVSFEDLVTKENAFLGFAISIAVTLTIFSLLINHFIVKRIKEIDHATLSIKDGNYDITLDTKGKDELTSLSQNFNLMTQELRSNEYLNKEFVRNFSHEFKTPLSVIRGYAELIEQSDLSEEDTKYYLDIIISESERLSNLTNNMLQISLIDSKAIIKKDDEYNITEQIRNVIQMTQLNWELKKLTFDLDMDEIKIKSNKELTYQIILNLLSNAVKYSSLKEEIKIKLKDNEKDFSFTITNKGQEIPQDDIDKVFKLFYIADKEKNKESTGVGLTLTKKIVDKLKGNITFSSDKGLTTFKVVLVK